MHVSIFDLFKIGIGPSSSHTVGPIVSSNMLIKYLRNKNLLKDVSRIDIELFGSLAYTGEGHKTFDALIIGLYSIEPDKIDNDKIKKIFKEFYKTNLIKLAGKYKLPFSKEKISLLSKLFFLIR